MHRRPEAPTRELQCESFELRPQTPQIGAGIRPHTRAGERVSILGADRPNR